MTGSLQKLLTWLSPAFPVGAFAWSGGLETAIAERAVTDSASTRMWIVGALKHGGIRTDAIIAAEAFRAFDDIANLRDLADLSLALAPTVERHQELTLTGAAFARAARAWPSDVYARLPSPCPYPVAIGAIAAAHGIALADTLIAYLTSLVQSQVSVAVRLVPIGHVAGLGLLAGFEAEIAAVAVDAETAGIAGIGGMGYAADIAQMRHEILEPRIFRS